MSQPTPSPEETAAWQKRLAAQANNRAWRLSESKSRSDAQDQEMLHAAHAAMHFWSIVGNENNKAHAIELLAHTQALLGNGAEARKYLAACAPYLSSSERAAWEVALFHAVAANVAASIHNLDDHASHYQRARQLIDAVLDPDDREIIEATFSVVPIPSSSVDRNEGK